jgi:hypothetical protein
MEQARFVNESPASAAAQDCPPRGIHGNIAQRAVQPESLTRHRASHMPFLRVPLAAAVAAFSVSVAAQTGAPGTASGAPSAAAPPSALVRPALSQVAQALNSVNTRRWKAPQPVRDEADQNISSIQRDLNGTLAGLLQQADGAPGSVPAAFAVYRNVDALYDTLLRVVETAELAAPESEESQLESALKSLEGARASLGDTILGGAQSEQAELVRLRTVIQAAAVQQRTPVKTVVVNDGPDTHETPVHHHHTAAKKPGSASSSGSGSQPQSSKPGANPQ